MSESRVSCGTERVLVLGMPRGATTWTSEILGTAHGARLVHEPDNAATDPYALVAKAGLGRYPAVERSRAPGRFVRLWTDAFHHGEPARTLKARASWRLFRAAPTSTRDDVLTGPSSIGARLLHFTLSSMAEPRCGGRPAPLNVVKSVHAAFCAELVTALVEPTVVVVRRNPLNVVSSWLDFGWAAQGLGESQRRLCLAGLDDVEPFAAASDVERSAIDCAILHRRFDRLIETHPDWVVADHDELCDAPVEQFRRLFRRLGLTWSASTESSIRASDANGTGFVTKRIASQERDRWKSRLDGAAAERVMAVFDHYDVRYDVAT